MNIKNEKLIKLFNKPETILVISSYPEKGVKYSGKVCAVGGYTKNTLKSLEQAYKKIGESKNFVVLTIDIDKEHLYREDNFLIWRLFKRNKISSYFKLLEAIRTFDKVKDVLIEFEFASFGNTRTTGLFPLVTWVLRALGKKSTLVLHQIVSDLSSISGHLGWGRSDIRSRIYNLLFRLFLFLLILPTYKVIVLEEEFKKRLKKLTGISKKVLVIPHGVDTKLEFVSKESSRKVLGINQNEKVVLYFGYLTWYKGVDILVKTFVENKLKLNNQPVKLIVAGGESATQKDKPHYQKFVKKVYKLAEKLKYVTVTGFVKEEDIPLYFAVSDLVVLPYRTFISSSGPLSLASSFRKPFIVSSQLNPYFKSADFHKALKQTKLDGKDMVFSLSNFELGKKILKVMNEKTLQKLAQFSANLSKQRSFEALSVRYIEALEPSGKKRYLKSLFFVFNVYRLFKIAL